MKKIRTYYTYLITNETIMDYFTDLYIEKNKVIKSYCNGLDIIKKMKKIKINDLGEILSEKIDLNNIVSYLYLKNKNNKVKLFKNNYLEKIKRK